MAEGTSVAPQNLEVVTVAEQKLEIKRLVKTPLTKGDIWYLIDTKWFNQWKEYVGFDTCCVGQQISAFPGAIDNGPLYADLSGDLKENLMDELDYMLVPQQAWNKLTSWYGIVSGQEPISRKVIEQGMFVKHPKVEVYLMNLRLCLYPNRDAQHVGLFSRADTIKVIAEEAKRIFKIKEDKNIRLWNIFMSNGYEELSKMDKTVQDAGLFSDQVICIVIQNDDGTWPRRPIHSTAKRPQRRNVSKMETTTTEHSKASQSSLEFVRGGRSGGHSGYSTQRGRGRGLLYPRRSPGSFDGHSDDEYDSNKPAAYRKTAVTQAPESDDATTDKKYLGTASSRKETCETPALEETPVDIAKFVQCSICLDVLKKPKVLPCLHTFCFICLQSWISTNTKSGHFKCPECNSDTEVIQGGASSFRDNFFVESLKDALPPPTGFQVKCDTCKYNEKNVSASDMCIQCIEHMCTNCAKYHHSSKATRNHQIVNIDDVRSGRYIEDIRANQKSFCTDHQEEMKLYCNDCEIPICLLCKAFDHDSHQMARLDVAAKTLDDKVNSLMDNLKQKVRDIENVTQRTNSYYEENIGTGREQHAKLTSWAKKLKERIDLEVGKAEQKISAREKELKAAHGNNIKSLNDTKHTLLSTIEYGEKIMTHAKEVEKLQQQTQMMQRLDSLQSTKVPDIAIGTSIRINVPDLKLPDEFFSIDEAT